MDEQSRKGFGDDQGTRVGAPDQSRVAPSEHADVPPARPARKSGAGSEATEGTSKTSEGHDREHRSGYGGHGGAPNTGSETREPKSK